MKQRNEDTYRLEHQRMERDAVFKAGCEPTVLTKVPIPMSPLGFSKGIGDFEQRLPCLGNGGRCGSRNPFIQKAE